jgi:hypothetical protein
MQAAKKNSPPNSSVAGETEHRSNFPPTIPIRHRAGSQSQHKLHLRCRCKGHAMPNGSAYPSRSSNARPSASMAGSTPSPHYAPRTTVRTFRPEGTPVSDTEERGVIFMALNASLSRQFEFVQQQWIQYATTPVCVMKKISCWAIMEAAAGLSYKGMRALQILRLFVAICGTL